MTGSQRPLQQGNGHPLRFLPATVFALAALLAVVPLLTGGNSCGHDFDFHLLSWMEAASQWQHGILKPVWAFTPAYNAGEPRLLFYPPLSWMTGAMTGLLLPWRFVPAAFTWLVLFLCGLTMHRLLRRWTSPHIAMLGGCLYLVNPYMLFCAYERTAYAELMAAAWMPLLIAAMLRTRLSVLRVAIVVSLLWLTNAPAAVMGSYSVLLLGVLRLILTHRQGRRGTLRVTGGVAAGVALGLLVDAFYLVPMAMERRYVQLALAVVPLARPDANFLFHRDNDWFHTHVMTQASWIGVGTIALALLSGAAVLLWQRRSSERRSSEIHVYPSMHARDALQEAGFSGRKAAIALTAYSAVILFLLSRWSAPVWHVAPEMVFLQFPWRLLAIQSAVTVALLCMALQRLPLRTNGFAVAAAALLIAGLAGWFAGGSYFREECDSDETVDAQRDQFVHEYGVGVTDEYTPVGADNDELHIDLPSAWIGTAPDNDPGKGAPGVPVERRHLDEMRYMTPAETETKLLILRLRKFPGWHVDRDGMEIDPETRDDGLMVVPLPAGRTHHIEVFHRTTADQWTGLGVSAATVLLIPAVLRRRRSGIIKLPK